MRPRLSGLRQAVVGSAEGVVNLLYVLVLYRLIGTPLIEIRTQFHKPATYGQTLTVHTEITEFSRKTFTHRHQVKRGDELICEGSEVRAFCTRDPETGIVKAIPIPDIVLSHCR